MIVIFLTSLVKIFPDDITINPIISISSYYFITQITMDIMFFSYKSFKDEFMRTKDFELALRSI